MGYKSDKSSLLVNGNLRADSGFKTLESSTEYLICADFL